MISFQNSHLFKKKRPRQWTSWLFLRKKLLRYKVSFKLRTNLCVFGIAYMFTLVVLVQPHKWWFVFWAKLFSMPSFKF